MTSLVGRGQIITLVQEAMDSGARQDRAGAEVNLNERTLQRWQVDRSRGDQLLTVESARAPRCRTTCATASQTACALRHCTQPVVQLGHHVSGDAGEGPLFLPVFVHGYF